MSKTYIYFMGGLGNQMFQYAFLKEWEALGRNAAADISWYKHFSKDARYELQQVFPNVSLPANNKLAAPVALLAFYGRKVQKRLLRKEVMPFEEKEHSCYDASIFDKTSGILQGYWQSEKYFQHAIDRVRNDFQFEIKDTGLEKAAQTIRNTPHSVAVHIRRGDYIDLNEIYGNICTDEYYERAIQELKERYPNATFFFFSNNVEWVREHYKGDNYRTVDTSMFESYENWYDLYLMSQCENNIIANSTFSWWGAWLNENPDKMVFAPKKWINIAPTPDIWCEGWIKI